MKEDAARHGGQLRQISERYGIPISELLDFSANINPEGPPPSVLQSLRNSIEDPSALVAYPDLEEIALKRSIAGYANIPPSSIAVSNGFVPLLQASLESLRIRHCLLPVPAFVEYRRSLTQANVRVTPQPLLQESSFRYDFDAMLSGDHDAILLANPQNPSGRLHDKAALIELTAAAGARNIYVLLDEAFIDYAPEDSLVDQVMHHPNLIVFRSVTKFFGIPGLRVAYAVASPQTVSALDRHLAPWPISTLASRAVQAALADRDFATASRRLNSQRKTELEAALRAIGLHVYPSSANFLLLRLPRHVSAETFCEDSILNYRVSVRNCSNYEALEPGHLRVAVRSYAESRMLLEAFQRCFSEALLH